MPDPIKQRYDELYKQRAQYSRAIDEYNAAHKNQDFSGDINSLYNAMKAAQQGLKATDTEWYNVSHAKDANNDTLIPKSSGAADRQIEHLGDETSKAKEKSNALIEGSKDFDHYIKDGGIPAGNGGIQTGGGAGETWRNITTAEGNKALADDQDFLVASGSSKAAAAQAMRAQAEAARKNGEFGVMPIAADPEGTMAALANSQQLKDFDVQTAASEYMGELGQMLKNFDFNLGQQAEQQKKSMENLPPEKQTAMMNNWLQSIRTNPNLSPYADGLTKEEAKGRDLIVNEYTRDIIDSVNRSKMAYQRNNDITNAHTRTQALSHNIRNGTVKAEDFGVNMASAMADADSISNYLTPQQRAEAYQSFAQEITNATIEKDAADTAKNNIDNNGSYNISAITSKMNADAGLGAQILKKQLAKVYGDENAENIPDDVKSIIKAQKDLMMGNFNNAVQAAAEQQKANLMEANLENYRGKDAYNENIRLIGTPAAFAQARDMDAKALAALSKDIDSGNINPKDFLKAKEWFMHTVEVDGELTSNTVMKLAEDFVNQIQRDTDNNADTNIAELYQAFEGDIQQLGLTKQKMIDGKREFVPLSNSDVSYLASRGIAMALSRSKGLEAQTGSIFTNFKGIANAIKAKLNLDADRSNDPKTEQLFNDMLNDAQLGFVRAVITSTNAQDLKTKTDGITGKVLTDILNIQSTPQDKQRLKAAQQEGYQPTIRWQDLSKKLDTINGTDTDIKAAMTGGNRASYANINTIDANLKIALNDYLGDAFKKIDSINLESIQGKDSKGKGTNHFRYKVTGDGKTKAYEFIKHREKWGVVELDEGGNQKSDSIKYLEDIMK